jgi:hypothetical protein
MVVTFEALGDNGFFSENNDGDMSIEVIISMARTIINKNINIKNGK